MSDEQKVSTSEPLNYDAWVKQNEASNLRYAKEFEAQSDWDTWASTANTRANSPKSMHNRHQAKPRPNHKQQRSRVMLPIMMMMMMMMMMKYSTVTVVTTIRLTRQSPQISKVIRVPNHQRLQMTKAMKVTTVTKAPHQSLQAQKLHSLILKV